MLGRRIARLYAGHDATQTQWASQRCIYDGVTLIEDRLYDQTHPDDGKLLGRYFYEAAINKLVSVQIPTADGLGLNEYIALTDDRGTIMGTADVATGDVLERLYYNSTGIAKVYDANDQPILRADGRNLGRSQFVPFGYTGMYKESFTGFLHTHFRDYDPIHRTWLSEDPAGYADGLNLNRAYFDVNGADELGLKNTAMSWGCTDSPDYHGRGSWLNWMAHGAWFGSHAIRTPGPKIKVQSRIQTINGLNPGVAKDLLITQLENETLVNYLFAAHDGGTEGLKQIAIEVAMGPLSELGGQYAFKYGAALSKKGYVFVKNSKGYSYIAKKIEGKFVALTRSEAKLALREAAEEALEDFESSAVPMSSYLLGNDKNIANIVKAVKSQEGYFDVVVHGGTNSFFVRRAEGWVEINHRSLANYIKKAGHNGESIRLLSCSTGSAPNGVAQNLSNKLGVSVVAPSDTLWIHSTGQMTIGTSPSLNTGEWRRFNPGGGI